MKIDIIGAGIGGLTIAIALEKEGITTHVFEQTSEIKPVGAGIIIANNAMQVYKKLGLKAEIEKNGNPISSMNVIDLKFRPISKINLNYFEEKYGVQNIAIHRGKLQMLLASKLKQGTLNLGHKLNKIEKISQGFQLEFNNGKHKQSEILIGADGLNSTVRNQLFKSGQIRNSYQVCWRGIAKFELPKEFQNELNEVWGNKDRFGFVKIDNEHVYWYAVKSFKNKNLFLVEDIEQYFENYHSIIKELLKLTPKKSIHTAILEDLRPINEWYKENVCLLGDAVHATTPNLGQGACQAIEDAYILSKCLSTYEVNKAFDEYQKLRIIKAHQVVKTSWNIGKVAHWENPLAIALRNGLMKLMPEKMNRKQSEKIFELEIV